MAIGSDVQAHDAQLDDIAGLTPTDGHIIIGDGSNFVTESGATARTSLGLAIGTNVQAHDAQLDDVAGLTPNSFTGLPFFTCCTFTCCCTGTFVGFAALHNLL